MDFSKIGRFLSVMRNGMSLNKDRRVERAVIVRTESTKKKKGDRIRKRKNKMAANSRRKNRK